MKLVSFSSNALLSDLRCQRDNLSHSVNIDGQEDLWHFGECEEEPSGHRRGAFTSGLCLWFSPPGQSHPSGGERWGGGSSFAIMGGYEPFQWWTRGAWTTFDRQGKAEIFEVSVPSGSSSLSQATYYQHRQCRPSSTLTENEKLCCYGDSSLTAYCNPLLFR